MKINVIDAIMGAGKTTSIIERINNDHSDNKYIYITPFLTEVQRIKKQCKTKQFKEPINFGKGKLDSLHKMMYDGINIASTHSLFSTSTEETIGLIKANNYILVMDEVMDVIEPYPLKRDDLHLMLSNELILVDDRGRVTWNPNKLHLETQYDAFKEASLYGTLILVNETMLMWNFPTHIFNAFKEVYILTYLFNAQIQRYYYDLFDIDYEYYTINNGTIIPVGNPDELSKYTDISHIKSLITIVEEDKLNGIGDDKYALSSTWFSKHADNNLINFLKKNVQSYFRYVAKANSKDVLWTVFKSHEAKFKGRSYNKGFVSCNIRATNDYGDRHCLAYCVNIFLNPVVKKYFEKYNIKVEEELYALSEILQWIWRSAIRNNESIIVYVPSSRMRRLLLDFLDN